MPSIDRHRFLEPSQRGEIGPRNDRLDQVLQAAPVQAAHGNRPRPGGAPRTQVDLVHHQHLASDRLQIPAFRRRIDHPHQHVGLFEMAARPPHALDFQRILRLAQSGRVDHAERNPAQGEILLDRVARRPRNVAHHGAVVADQQIEQTRLARVRLAVDDQPHPLAQHAAFVRGRKQPAHRRRQIIDPLQQRLATLRINPLLRKIDERFEVSDRGQQFLAQTLDHPAQPSFQLPRRGPRGRFTARIDQVHHRFGLGQIHLAVEEGTLREFARRGRPRPGGKQGGEHGLRHDHAAMTADLHHVLTGVAARCAEHGEQHLVQHHAVTLDAALDHPAGRNLRHRAASAEHAAGQFHRPRAAHADQCHGPGPERRGQRGDRVRRVHQPALTIVPPSNPPSLASSRRAAMKTLFCGMVPTDTRIHSGKP